jgi:hypothetical protein
MSETEDHDRARDGRPLPLTMEDFTLPSQRNGRPDLSPEFAELDRQFTEALEEEIAAINDNDYSAASIARIAMATEKAWEVWLRIEAKEVVYAKDLRVRDRPVFWMLKRHPQRFLAEAAARSVLH